MAPEEINDQKRVEYYAASVNAWFNTSLEHDKSLLTLSAGGIGLLLTLLTTVGLSSTDALVLYIGAIVSFVVSLVAILIIFRRNRTYIEDIFSGKSTDIDPLLTKLDTTALWAFGIGVLFTAIIGLIAAIHSYSTKEKNMANETTNKTVTLQLGESFNCATNIRPGTESFNGASSLQPTTEFTKSFNGVGKLQPQPVESTTAPAASVPTPAPSGSSQKQKGNSK